VSTWEGTGCHLANTIELSVCSGDAVLCQITLTTCYSYYQCLPRLSRYRRMLRISWTEHRTNESVLNEIGIDRELVATVKKRKLQYFGHMIRAQNLWGDDIKDWTGRTLADCVTTARNRNSWRELVRHSAVCDLQQ